MTACGLLVIVLQKDGFANDPPLHPPRLPHGENMRNVERPVTTNLVNDPMSDSVTTHPAFGLIGASRVSGQTSLYGSDFVHQNFVTITIRKSKNFRGLSRDWHAEDGDVASVALSEAQWASFVSSLNCGSGVPCTLEYVMGENIPMLPPPEDVSGKFADEMSSTLLEIQQKLEALSNDARLPAWAKREIGLSAARITGSTGFVAKQFSEHVEEAVEKAKIEVNAYATATIQKAGLAAIANGVMPIALPEKVAE